MTSLDVASSDRFLNRELSWLDYNARVLAQAEDANAPVLERAKFLAIFAGNLDEFYMVRVAGLKRQVAAGLTSPSPDGRSPREQLHEISERAQELARRHSEIFLDDVRPELSLDGIKITRWDQLDDDEQKELDELFTERIFPVVTPLAVDPGHPFPYISHLSLNLAVQVRDPEGEIHFARVKVPPVISRFVALSNEVTFVPLEDVIAANLDQLFPGMEIVEHHVFRVTRNADLEVDDEGAEDLLQALEEELRKRRFSPAVRLETEGELPIHILELLRRELQITEADVHVLEGPLGLSDLWTLYDLDRPDLKDEPIQPATHPGLTKWELGAKELVTVEEPPGTIFDTLRDRGDIIVHHPYDSFRTSVQRFIEQAAGDPDVLAIKQTLYRTSGESPIVDALIDAAEAGKQVVVLVEIQARFDERANIQWARTLEQAGCHVVYGVVGLKTHCKLCLVVRREGTAIHRYAHVGTGNYNPKTARLYEDIGLLTADQQLGSDVSHLFNYLTGYSRTARYNELIVAPADLRAEVVAMIQREATHAREGEEARIILKVNALVDEVIIDALYSASQEGVDIELVVRGICALKPGIPGLSETIRVRSILGRFLEHSRIFYFRNGGGEDMYIGSADLMHRNLDRRVEALARVTSSKAKEQLKDGLKLALADNSTAWTLDADGTWARLRPAEGQIPVSLQKELMDRARSNA